MPVVPLLRQQPALYVSADGIRHSHSVHYKDEGGKSNTYAFDINLLDREQEISVGAKLVCDNPKCAREVTQQFVSPHFFRVTACQSIRARNKKKAPDPHMLNGDRGIGAWSKQRNVYTLCADEDCAAARVHCNFLSVNNSLKCKGCGCKTFYQVCALTDAKRTVELAPVLVKSKRKIPVYMRKKDEKEIEDFMRQKRTRKKRSFATTKRQKGVATKDAATPKAYAQSGRKKQRLHIDLSQCSSVVREPHLYDDSVKGDLILQNERLAALNNDLQEELVATKQKMELLLRYCRAELTKTRQNFDIILHHTNELTTSYNALVAKAELKFYDPYEDGSQMPIDFFANLDQLPSLEAVADADFDIFSE